MVAARLRELTAEGLLEKFPYQEPGQRTRSGYRLTEKGSDLLPVLVAMMRWGDRWLFPDGARVELTHTRLRQPGARGAAAARRATTSRPTSSTWPGSARSSESSLRPAAA